jgi:hypothetical protein
MKKLITAILTFGLTATMALAGQVESSRIKDKSGSTKARFSTDSSGTTTFRDNSGRRLGTIDKSGVSRDNSGRRQSTISRNGTVRDSSGRRQGQFTTDSSGTKTFRDNSGRTQYRIQKNGDIRDNSGRLMGKIDER